MNLRARVISGDLPPGSRLDVTEIGRRYGASHIPIREALRKLETEGLLIHTANKSVYVAPLSREEADGLYDARIMLEPQIALRAIRARSKADIATARRINRSLRELDSQSDPVKFQHLHHRFHASLLLPGMTPTLRRVLEPVWQGSERYLVFVYSRPGAPTRGHIEHEQLLDFWIDGDSEAFVALLLEHLQSARVNLAERLAPPAAEVTPSVPTCGDEPSPSTRPARI
jgi:DNA-binding GntR family transcriptional regulator